MSILTCETLIGEPTCFGDCARLDGGGSLRRLVPQGGHIVLWEGPGTEVRDNRIGTQVGFGVNMKEVDSSERVLSLQSLRVCVVGQSGLTTASLRLLAIIAQALWMVA